MHQLSSPLVSHLPVAVGETLAGKYRIERIIGEGGMGVVVAAHHLELDQPVAIKFLLESVADEEGAERFRREARAAAKIHSDHVVRVLDVGVLDDEGVRYMVMEYLEGRDLAEELVQRGSLPIGVACGIILEALDAIGQAHTVGIVHRDLKPANLFLANRPDGSTRVKVLDFGISKSVGQSTVEQLSLTKTSAWIGSPLYMAPEQMQSARDVDARADIWSLGAILYEMISGSPPYEADSLPQLCNLLITKDAPHLAERCPAIPSDLADLIMGCLVRDREQRIARTVDLAATLGRYATTSTGSGMSRTLLERTELQGVQSMPGSAMMHSQGPLSGGHAAQDRGSLPGLPVEGGKTHAAWGGTDPGQSGSTQGRLKVVALALAALVSVGAAVVAFGGGSASPESAPEELVVEQQGASLKVEKEAAGVAEAKEEDLPEPEPSQPDPPPTEDAAGPATRPKAVQRAQPAPPPAVRPRPTVQQPAPKPTPEPAPAKTGGEDIEDLFGGRR